MSIAHFKDGFGRPGSIDHFYTLDPIQKLINMLTKRKIWAKSENSDTQIGLGKDILPHNFI